MLCVIFYRCGGRCFLVEYIDKFGEFVKLYGLKLYIDGVCIFNVFIVRVLCYFFKIDFKILFIGFLIDIGLVNILIV